MTDVDSLGPTRTKKRCRASMARTTLVVQRATSTWSEIFGRKDPGFNSPAVSCEQLARDIKKHLGTRQSDDEAEQMAFQSIKRLLPPSCKCQQSGFLKALSVKQTSCPPRLPDGYLSFVRKQVNSLFPKGWDSGLYEQAALLSVPKASACIEEIRSHGGCGKLWVGQQSDYLDIVLNGAESNADGGLEWCTTAQAFVVQSAGKPRPLTKFSSETFVLKPLHDAIYNRLSRKRWLLRGEIAPDVLDRAGFLASKGKLVSGDYKSATDGLPIAVAEAAMTVLLENCVSVPDTIRQYALDILRPTILNSSVPKPYEVTVGQMMGSYLSFPLLCIQNFLAFTWARVQARLPVLPLLINGDDILFQDPSSDGRFTRSWMSMVRTLGLEVEQTKTSVSESFGSLNSTLLTWRSGFLRVSHTLRFGMLRPSSFPNELGASFRSFLGPLQGDLRFRAARQFMLWHKSEFHGIPLHELGFRGSLAWRLECKLRLSSPHAWSLPLRDLPKPPSKHGLSLPHDRVTLMDKSSLSRELLQLNFREMVSWRWTEVAHTNLDRYVPALFDYLFELSKRRDWRCPARVAVSELMGPFRPSILEDQINRKRARGRYFRPWSKDVEEVHIFDSVLITQLTDEYEFLPPYQESESVGECDKSGGACRIIDYPEEKGTIEDGLPVRSDLVWPLRRHESGWGV